MLKFPIIFGEIRAGVNAKLALIQPPRWTKRSPAGHQPRHNAAADREIGQWPPARHL